MSHFNHARDSGGKESVRVPAREQANEFLDGAARSRNQLEEIEQKRLRRARESGGLAKNTTDEEINNYANKVGFHSQAFNIVNNPPSREAMSFMKKTVESAQHANGSTYTNKFGDMRGTSAAKQRGDNTRLSEMDEQLGQKMKEAAGDYFDTNQIESATQASLQALAVDNFDPEQMAKATQASLKEAAVAQFDPSQMVARASMNSNAFNTNLRSTMGPRGGMVGFGMTPPHPLTPFSVGKVAEDETPADIVEVRDEAFEEIMLSSDSTRGHTLQGVVEGLTRPRDDQLVKANALLSRKGKSATERLNGLVRFEDNRQGSKGSKKN